MKYIIEIENEPFGRNDDPFFPHGMDELYRAKGFKSLVFDQDGLDKLTPYTEPDRQDIEDEVWEFAKKVRLEEFIDEEGRLHGYISGFNSYSEAKSKYEEWKKQKDEIHIGDEVEYECCDELVTFVVTGTVGKTAYGFKISCDYDDVGEYCDIKDLRKTGRSFHEIADALKKMGEEE